MLRIFFFSIFVCLFVFTSYTYAKEVCIKNFNKSLCSDFKVLKSVIIKSPLSKDELSKKLDKPIRQIAFLEDSNLYLVEVKDSLGYAKYLSKLDHVIYAQANISQSRNKQTVLGSKKLTQTYKLDILWKKTKGESVNIAIIDDGFDLKHEDLKGLRLSFSYDVDNKSLGFMPRYTIDTHGTQVAGIIFARHNGIGIDGIAPEANLIAIRQTTNITSDTILAFTVAKKAGADIINCSWNSPILLEPVYDIIKAVAKDTAIVFAAGNSHKQLLPYSIEASIPEVITVAATQNYSNYGDMVDFTIKSNILTTAKNGRYKFFGGTSAAAPVISGLLALKMSEQKDKEYTLLVEELKKSLENSFRSNKDQL